VAILILKMDIRNFFFKLGGPKRKCSLDAETTPTAKKICSGESVTPEVLSNGESVMPEVLSNGESVMPEVQSNGDVRPLTPEVTQQQQNGKYSTTSPAAVDDQG
jgi:hypothetical protein